jgi:predicted small lipoprotein YifL
MTRTSMRTSLRTMIVSLATALAALAGCGQTPAREAPADTTAAAGTGVIHPGLRWDSQVSGAGIALTLFDAAGAPLLRLGCARDPAVMTVVAETFRPVGSEERLSFGVDGEPFAFVADPTAERPAGVEAEAPIIPELLDRMENAREVSVVYGAQTLGPHMPPDPETTRRFVSACRQILQR